MNKKLYPLLLAALTFFFSCSKDNPTPNPSDNNGNNNGGNNNQKSSAPDLFSFLKLDDASGVFVGVWSFSQQSTPMGNMDITVGTAVAMLGDIANGKFNDVGEVKCFVGTSPQAYPLTKQENNAYVYMPSATQPLGIPYQKGSAGIPFWEVASLNISTGSYYQFPTKPEIKSALTIDRTKDYEFTISAPHGAEEILYVIASEGEYVHKTIKRDDPEYISNKVVFKASELSNLKTTEHAIIQAAPYTLYKKEISGKQYYFINEVVVTQIVTIK